MPVVFLRRLTIISKDGVTTVLTEYKIKKCLKKRGDWRSRPGSGSPGGLETGDTHQEDEGPFLLLPSFVSRVTNRQREQQQQRRNGIFLLPLDGVEEGGWRWWSNNNTTKEEEEEDDGRLFFFFHPMSRLLHLL